MGKIISIANQKGGVGKTTTAINLSSCLAKFNHNTLLIDLDPQGNATSGIGVDKGNLNYNIYDILIGEEDISDVITRTEYNNLSLIPSNSDLTSAEVKLTPMMARELRLKSQLFKIKDQFEFIIIDCPPSLGLLTINALTASDSVLIPLQCEYYALEGLSQLLTTIELVRENLNSSLMIEGMLLTMCDLRTNLSSQVINDVRNHFSNKVYNAIIPRAVRISESPSFGKPIIYYAEKSAGAENYINFTIELLQKNALEIAKDTEIVKNTCVPHGTIENNSNLSEKVEKSDQEVKV